MLQIIVVGRELETKAAGVQFIGIDVRDNDAAAKSAEHTLTINYL